MTDTGSNKGRYPEAKTFSLTKNIICIWLPGGYDSVSSLCLSLASHPELVTNVCRFLVITSSERYTFANAKYVRTPAYAHYTCIVLAIRIFSKIEFRNFISL